ncbi:SMI1/KNR4 family protein [Spirillospora albida]|uniref:SMI1/KNR4 family protein n=1 Tax=Spirillospora albida TaxID=58123 RepID=UPI0004BE66A9|nr:SMI1/KNR4 family protein [Spirillospora albida]
MSEVLRAWARITGWLREHAPLSHASLSPGATRTDISAAQHQLGFSLHEELIALLLVNNGSAEEPDVDGDDEGEIWPGEFLNGHHLLPLENLRAERLRMVGLASSEQRAHLGSWVPWTAPLSDPQSFTMIDHRGLIGHFSYGTWELQPSDTSLPEYLSSIADALELGTGPLITPTRVPGTSLGALLWGDPANPPVEEAPWAPVHG